MSENNLASAMCRLQGELEHVKRDTRAYNYKYAQLDQCWDTIKQPMIKNGFSLIQLPYNDEDRIGIHSILLHSSGEKMESRIAIRPQKADPQSLGSLLTYLRRYSLMSIIGLCPVDDDGAGAMPGAGSTPQPASKPKNIKPVTAAQVARLNAIVANSHFNMGEVKEMCVEFFKKEHCIELTMSEYDELVEAVLKGKG
jgi:hypothetical protein